MKFHLVYLIIALIFLNISCSKEKEKISIIQEKSLEMQMIEAYNQGLKELEQGDAIYAARKFNEAELLYPQSLWAPRSSLMSAYSYYKQSYYINAIDELRRFIKIYPNNERIDYAYYLLGMCYYEQIADEKKDLGSIIDAKQIFNFIIKDFPNSEFALDAEFKLELIEEILASKEMYLAKYYIEREKWIPAINRFKTVINKYDTTIYAEEALHRLVEIHYVIGLKEEAKKYANLLGYNYQSSKWYEKSYSVFDNTYEKNKIKNKKRKKTFLGKFKSLFD